MSKEIMCPRCGRPDEVVKNGSRRLRSAGQVQRYLCRRCGGTWSARFGTALEGLRTAPERIASALHARTEGVGVRATARLIRTSPETIRRWEQRVAERGLDDEEPLPAAFSPVIESDEVYTRVHHNRPASESPGWTLISMERGSRFWLATATGRREQPLFDQGMAEAWDRAGNRPGVWLSDGERRYEQALWPLARQWQRGSGRPKRQGGRRKGTQLIWAPGVLVARKRKGSQGPRRYERADRLHWRTQDIEDAEIHANHLEAFNASLRRRCSAFRRRTNTYAKNTPGLNRALTVQRRVHNYVRPHPGLKRDTTPAMAVGLAAQPWTLLELLAA